MCIHCRRCVLLYSGDLPNRHVEAFSGCRFEDGLKNHKREGNHKARGEHNIALTSTVIPGLASDLLRGLRQADQCTPGQRSKLPFLE